MSCKSGARADLLGSLQVLQQAVGASIVLLRLASTLPELPAQYINLPLIRLQIASSSPQP